MDHFEAVAQYAQACHYLGIEKLKKVYLAIIITEYTLEGRTIKDLNEKFKDRFVDKKWVNYEELTEERMDELKKLFPIIAKGEKEQAEVKEIKPEETKEEEKEEEE